LTSVDGRVTFALSPLTRGIFLARKILLADDSVTAQNMGRKILADAGYEVIAVNNGSAALKKIAELKPDLVILDVYMPGYSGLEVCQRLKESQETARIPVLLSVGKLEPFKPEEAQRVRADGFIVKPFEASELLSALSKLEDKVVPRAEPSKPGRFARAIAAAEESDRGSRKERTNDLHGWNSRIGFPHEKTKPEEKIEDDSAIYNPMNRDLRTVVETAAEKSAGEAIVDAAALTPEGLPKDVTPEEVAAIAAAAAQIQRAGAAVPDSSGSPDRIEDNFVSPVLEQAKTEGAQESKIGVAADAVGAAEAEPRSAEPHSAAPHVSGDVRARETQDLPVTMAAVPAESVAASVDVSRWTAVAAAVEGEEATISLEAEMQKAYAAYAPYVAAEADSAGVATLPEVEAAAAGNSSTSEVAPVVEAAPAENFSSPEVATFVADAESSPAVFAEPAATPPPVAEPAGLIAQEAPEARESATEPTGDYTPNASVDEPAAESRPDSEAVKSTAAAWASWRQIRDTHKDGEAVQAQTREFEVSESAPAETAAMAVAAGAEQIVQETSAAPKGDSADVASIVESVLANLRPKLMEEISRKMAEKK
jgi:two-component system chemotaxis response regulator CheY